MPGHHATVSKLANKWRSQSSGGACAPTLYDEGIGCHNDDSGSWLLSESGKGVDHRIVACLHLCLSCARCRFISVAIVGEPDCSWYASCDADAHNIGSGTHLSGAVDASDWHMLLGHLGEKARKESSTTLARMPAGGWQAGPGAGHVDLEFVHITSNAGTAIETWGERHGFKWGFRQRDLPARLHAWTYNKHLLGFDYQLHAWNQEAWHTPPAMLLSGNASVWYYRPWLRPPHLMSTADRPRHLFCVVRHPVCRVIAQFRSKYDPHSRKCGNCTLEEWLSQQHLRETAGPFPTRVHGMAVVPWFSSTCDSFLRHETLQKDFTALIARFAPRHAHDSTLPYVSNAEVQDRTLSYHLTPRLLQQIGRAYAADMHMFGYTLHELPCARHSP